jgi:hypothetical protein
LTRHCGALTTGHPQHDRVDRRRRRAGDKDGIGNACDMRGCGYEDRRINA